MPRAVTEYTKFHEIETAVKDSRVGLTWDEITASSHCPGRGYKCNDDDDDAPAIIVEPCVVVVAICSNTSTMAMTHSKA